MLTFYTAKKERFERNLPSILEKGITVDLGSLFFLKFSRKLFYKYKL